MFVSKPDHYLTFSRAAASTKQLNLSKLKSGGGTVGSVTKRKTNSTVKKDII